MLQFQLNKQGDQQFGQNKEYNMVLTFFHDIVQKSKVGWAFLCFLLLILNEIPIKKMIIKFVESFITFFLKTYQWTYKYARPKAFDEF
jgi:hypothetical protein